VWIVIQHRIGHLSLARETIGDAEYRERVPKAWETIKHWLDADSELAALGLTYTLHSDGGTSEAAYIEAECERLGIKCIRVFEGDMGAWPVELFNPDPETRFDPSWYMANVVRLQILAGIGIELARRELGGLL
jgi:hypothetical protein